MITKIRIENFLAFSEYTELSLHANMKIKRLMSNISKNGKANIVKTLALYGPNNSGKTCFVRAFETLKNIMINKPRNINRNIFGNNNIVKLGLSFTYNEKEYNFDVSIDSRTLSFVYEKFSETITDEYNNKKENILLLRDLIKNQFKSSDAELNKIMEFTSNDNILIYLLDESKFSELKDIKSIIINVANQIEIVSMDNLKIQKTIDMLKNDEKMHAKIANFVKNADLYLDDFRFSDEVVSKMTISKNGPNSQEKTIADLTNIPDNLKLVSVYKGIPLPSVLYDSLGTRKIASLASYIIDTIENGKILIVDELDSSLHYKITRAIVAMFNNEMNKNGQLIFTVHDVNLLDIKKLLRKEQIAFINKNEEGVSLYSLEVFSSQDGVRDSTDLIEKYKKGFLGAVPNPNMFKALLGIVNDKK